MSRLTLAVFVTGLAAVYSCFAEGETLDFDGAILLDCQCPSPSMAGNCGTRGRTQWNYTIQLFVRDGMDVDPLLQCFRKRDGVVCCDEPKSAYHGSIEKKCPGKSSC